MVQVVAELARVRVVSSNGGPKSGDFGYAGQYNDQTMIELPAICSPVGRLAPSPTGAQHVGNARTYLLAWLSIRSRRGRLILRMEDIDSPRVKRGAAEQAIDDLRWLGLDWDEGPFVQTQRLEHYGAALDRLKAAERVYPCTCTRSDIAAAASAPHAGQEGPVYPGTCASRSAHDAEALIKSGVPIAWRFRSSDKERVIHDLVTGEERCNVACELGDFVVGKSDGTPAYQLAVVVDDAAMGVTEVLRGDDLLPSAFRQLELYEALGAAPPAFAHVPLVVGPDGRRLAKRHGDTRLATLRQQRVAPERLVGLLAWSCGLADSPKPCLPGELLPNFSLSRIPLSPWVWESDANL
jgi:glutamyl-tRNA synthetase